MIIKNTFYIILFLVFNFSFSQCKSGDCKNGFGKFDYGYAIYSGNFLNSKPSGQGTMDYGGGDKFEGNFVDGKEDGKGILYKKNIPKNVNYVNGKIKIYQEIVSVGGNAPKIDGCIQGDCYNGFGIITFSSGNRYEGNFNNGSKQGLGKFIFVSGNEYNGSFVDNLYSTGTFKFKLDGIIFTGTFFDNGSPKTGKYDYQNNQSSVEVQNGVITKVDNAAERAKTLQSEHDKHFAICPKCKGAGSFETTGYSAGSTTRTELGASINSNTGAISHLTSVKTTEGGFYTDYTICSECNGRGEIRKY